MDKKSTFIDPLEMEGAWSENRTSLIEPSIFEESWDRDLTHYVRSICQRIDAKKKAKSNDAKFKEAYSQLYHSDLSLEEKEEEVLALINQYFPNITF